MMVWPQSLSLVIWEDTIITTRAIALFLLILISSIYGKLYCRRKRVINTELGLSQLEKKLTDMLEDAVEAVGFELLGVEFVRAGKHSTLRVYIDSENGIDVDDCAEVSHQVSAVLDIEDPINTEYNLEISSPGMDRPLFKPSHYEKVLSQTISVKLQMPMDGRRNFKGKLITCDEQGFEIQIDNQTFTLPYTNVMKANLVPEFD